MTSGPLLLSAVPHATTSSGDVLRVGVTIGKRVAPRAVDRNRVKRLLRTAVRTFVRSIEATSITHLDAVVLIWRKRPEAPGLLRLADVQEAVNHAMTKALSSVKVPS